MKEIFFCRIIINFIVSVFKKPQQLQVHDCNKNNLNTWLLVFLLVIFKL